MRVLIVEDDADLCELMALNLRREGYRVDTCADGEEGLWLIRQQGHDLVLLDRMLPEMDGVSLLRTARKEGIAVPVLMVTALGGAGQAAEGLDSGADDYIIKPFAADELLARVRAMSRRPRELSAAEAVTWGPVRLEMTDKRLVCGEKECTLSKRETDLLELFLRHVGKTLPRAVIFTYVWGADTEVENGNLDNYIHYVRDRLREVECSLSIVTVRGVGYRLEERHV